MIRRTFNLHELPSLVEAIFSSKDEIDTIRCLGDGAQAFIDAIDEARPRSLSPICRSKFTSRHSIKQALDVPNLSPRARRNCLRSLYRTCGRHALLPRTLKIPVCYDRTGVAMYRGGFADVWKGKHRGRDVAVKVIRTYSNSDLQKLIGVSRAAGRALFSRPVH